MTSRSADATLVFVEKSRPVAYLLWLLLGLLGAHRFYLREPVWGLIYLVTGGLFMLGWFTDALFLGDKVDEYNARLAEDGRLARARLLRR